MQITQANAGDNYIIAVHPNSSGLTSYRFDEDDETLEYYDPKQDETQSLQIGRYQTSTLTVWRTLNVECDTMEYYPGATDTGTVITPPDPSQYLDDFVASELARACVITSVYTPNTHQPPVGHNPMTDEEYDLIHGRINSGSGRDILGNTPLFWTVRIVMASKKRDNVIGAFNSGTNTILMRYETMKELWSNATAENLGMVIRWGLLHEIAHCLIDGRHKSTGVRTAEGLSISNVLLPQYKQFLTEDIQEIQMYSRARN